MEAADRPTWSHRGRFGAGATLFGIALLLTLVGAEGSSSAVIAAVAVASAIAVVTWSVVRTRRQRRDFEARLTAWAAERAAHAERLRIARDLHDLASHGLGLITIRAAATRSLAGPGADDERRRALGDIETAGREATTELRRMLAVLRTGGDAAPVRPADTWDDLPAVVAAATAAGAAVEPISDEPPRASPGAQLTACTVLREALANAVRHAGPTRVRIVLRRAGDVVEVDVHDDGPAPGWTPQPGAGHGIAGLRERVESLGGVLDAGPDGAGFRLVARIPDPEPT